METTGRRGDAQLRKAVDGLVGHVNGRFGRADYCPVLYVKHTLAREEVVALYSIADVVLVTSVREGINLSAMEFVACQSGNDARPRADPARDDSRVTAAQAAPHVVPAAAAAAAAPHDAVRAAQQADAPVGVLIYSEFAGCASSFGDGALVVNPHDTDGVAEALHTALTMSRTTKQVRQHKLARYVNTYTAELWATRLVRELRLAREKASEYRRLLPLDVAQLRSFYERSRRRLLIFEYDGGLAHHSTFLLRVSFTKKTRCAPRL